MIQFVKITGNVCTKESYMASMAIGELWGFIRTRKKYWLLPIIIALLLLGALIILAESSAVAPFVYTIF